MLITVLLETEDSCVVDLGSCPTSKPNKKQNHMFQFSYLFIHNYVIIDQCGAIEITMNKLEVEVKTKINQIY